MVYRADLTGLTVGRLTVIKRNGQIKGTNAWLCKCECGNKTNIVTGSLTSKKTRSCGCLKRDRTIEMFRTHGFANTRIYNIWTDMKKRCNNPNHTHYDKYGGRGIELCNEWDTFEGFHKDMSDGYKDNLTIDRIDNDKGYHKDNCRWVTQQEQLNNYSRNVFITINGETDTVKNMCRKYNSKYDNVVRQIKNGCDPWGMIQKYKLD